MRVAGLRSGSRRATWPCHARHGAWTRLLRCLGRCPSGPTTSRDRCRACKPPPAPAQLLARAPAAQGPPLHLQTLCKVSGRSDRSSSRQPWHRLSAPPQRRQRRQRRCADLDSSPLLCPPLEAAAPNMAAGRSLCLYHYPCADGERSSAARWQWRLAPAPRKHSTGRSSTPTPLLRVPCRHLCRAGGAPGAPRARRRR